MMKDASSEARNRIAAATSVGCADPPDRVRRRDTGDVFVRKLLQPRRSPMVPGATALTRMPWEANSTARCLVMPGGDELRRPVNGLALLSGLARDGGQADDRAAARSSASPPPRTCS